jgi:hypothetical protein
MPSISALLRPGPNDFPIASEFRVFAGLFETGFFEASDFDEFRQVVRMAGLHLLLVGEFTTLSSLCYASLERTLHSVASQIVYAPSNIPRLSSAVASFSLTFESSWRSFRSTSLHHTACPTRFVSAGLDPR